METSCVSLERMLYPSNPSLTVASLGKAAAALGRKVELRFVAAPYQSLLMVGFLLSEIGMSVE